MIIHIWLHWFWVTSSSLRGFLLFTVQMISLSCISQSLIAEAGLLNNNTFTNSNVNLYRQNDSSQIGNISNITLHPIETVKDEVPEELIVPSASFSLAPVSGFYEEMSTGSPENESTSKHEDLIRIGQTSVSDITDTYNGGNFDSFQYPSKKFTKYSHIKYGKVKIRPKSGEETGSEEKKEGFKIVQEKLNINISMAENDAGHVEPVVDNSNDTLPEEENSKVLTTLPPVEDTTIESNEREFEKESITEEPIMKDEPAKPENVTNGPGTTTAPTSGAINSSEINITKDQINVQIVKNDTLVIENKVEESVTHTTVEPFILKTRVAAATSAQSQNADAGQPALNAGSITGITLGILVIFSLFGAVSFVLYRRRYLNKPQVLHDKCSNLDSSGYIDDTSLRENSEEMYSLDNDSFLNSLEAMTIQNYWTESVKHTKL